MELSGTYSGHMHKEGETCEIVDCEVMFEFEEGEGEAQSSPSRTQSRLKSTAVSAYEEQLKGVLGELVSELGMLRAGAGVRSFAYRESIIYLHKRARAVSGTGLTIENGARLGRARPFKRPDMASVAGGGYCSQWKQNATECLGSAGLQLLSNTAVRWSNRRTTYGAVKAEPPS